MKSIILLISLMILISCAKKNPVKDIIASFPPNQLDYNIPPTCGENDGYYNRDSEIVLIKEEEFNSIIERLNNLKPSKENNDCASDFSFLLERINIVRAFTMNVSSPKMDNCLKYPILYYLKSKPL